MYLRIISFTYLLLVFVQHLATGDAHNNKTQEMHHSSLSPSEPATKGETEAKKYRSKYNFHESKQFENHDATSSCIDRCHVNYLSYKNRYQKRIFLHKNHSPDQGLQCNLCHANDPAGTETHGKLIMQHKECISCHHKDTANEDCWRCHAEVKEYMEGNIQEFNTKLSDFIGVGVHIKWPHDIQGFNTQLHDLMAKDVSCIECHQMEPDGTSFKAVRSCCVECHDSDSSYGVIYDLWKQALYDELTQCCENEIDIIMARQNQFYQPDDSFISQLMNATVKILFRDIPALKNTEDSRWLKTLQKKEYLQLDISNRQNLLQFVQSYGMHNVLLSHILLKYIRAEQQRLKDPYKQLFERYPILKYIRTEQPRLKDN